MRDGFGGDFMGDAISGSITCDEIIGLELKCGSLMKFSFKKHSEKRINTSIVYLK